MATHQLDDDDFIDDDEYATGLFDIFDVDDNDYVDDKARAVGAIASG